MMEFNVNFVNLIWNSKWLRKHAVEAAKNYNNLLEANHYLYFLF